jgi:hypothetical protein
MRAADLAKGPGRKKGRLGCPAGGVRCLCLRGPLSLLAWQRPEARSGPPTARKRARGAGLPGPDGRQRQRQSSRKGRRRAADILLIFSRGGPAFGR